MRREGRRRRWLGGGEEEAPRRSGTPSGYSETTECNHAYTFICVVPAAKPSHCSWYSYLAPGNVAGSSGPHVSQADGAQAAEKDMGIASNSDNRLAHAWTDTVTDEPDETVIS